jgi:hypothetical protein
MRKFLVVLIIGVGLLVAADRIGAVVAGREVASRVQTAYNLPSKPSVSVRGFPFLTQLASGNYHEIDVSVPSVSANGVTVDGLTARLTGVRAPLSNLFGHSPSGITAANVAGSGTVPFSSVRTRLPRGVQLSQDGGALRLAGTVTYLGVTVPVSADASLSATGSGIAVTPTRISVASGSSSALSSVISGLFGFVIPVTGLPLHLTVDAVTVVPGGVRVSASAANVAFTSGS